MSAKHAPPATQYSIARALGVSQSAVSFVLSGKGDRVSPGTRDDILQKARELGYRPRAKGMKSPPVVAYLTQDEQRLRPVYAIRFVRGIQEEADRAGFIIAQHVLDGEVVPERILESAKLCITNAAVPQSAVDAIAERMPTALLHWFDRDGRHDSVMPDNASGVRKAVSHLVGLGHRRFAFFGIRDWQIHQAERYGAFHQVLSELGLPDPRPDWILTPYRRERSITDVERLVGEALQTLKRLRAGPTALICDSDQSAFAFLRLANGAGLRAPRDLSVVGFDNLDECESSRPTLSSVAQPLEDMGAQAFRLTMERAGHRGLPARRLRLDTDWKPRGSVGPAPRGGKRRTKVSHDRSTDT